MLLSKNQNPSKESLKIAVIAVAAIVPLEYFGLRYSGLLYWYSIIISAAFIVENRINQNLRINKGFSFLLYIISILAAQLIVIRDVATFMVSASYFILVYISYTIIRRKVKNGKAHTFYFSIDIILRLILIFTIIQLVYIYIDIDLAVPRYIDQCCTARWAGNSDEVASWFYGTEGYLYTTKRANGLYQEASIFVFFISLFVLPFYLFYRQYFSIHEKSKAKHCTRMALLYLLALLASKSSAGLLMFVVYSFIFSYVLRSKALLLSPLLILTASGLFLSGALDKYYLKLTDLSYDSSVTRLVFAEAMLDGVLDRPILGFGKSKFSEHAYNYISLVGQSNDETQKQLDDNVFVVSVAYLGFAVDYGCLALAGLIFLIYKCLKRSINNNSQGCIAFFIALATCLFSNLIIYMPYVIFGFALFSGLNAISFRSDRHESTIPTA